MENFQYLKLKDIHTNPYQPRKTFSQEKLLELANSIKENGIIQPIIVRKSPVIGYELLAGERRYRAAKLAELESVPALIKNLTDQDMMRQAIIENLQREDLNPIEEAESYQSLIDKGLTHEELAKIMGKSRPYISNLVRLLNLSQTLIEAVKKQDISQAHARLLVPLTEQKQVEWLEKITKEDISVRDLEKKLSAKKPAKKRQEKEIFIREEEARLKQQLGTEVTIQLAKNQAGKITISFADPEEYQRIINSFK
ncbi:ParB/RepB/Spo0J family partition protein [Streptococcus oricebi]|uniref:Chromosome partitioning protein n=1 Tax=Streptococcus oricebi TaxID=1547447 RepID=A0ABS5B5T3_9STRE|nr:ParB/RepB/Spo0J family partition protein [Streptococcus oricebi]MBP2624110.1 chromosome partitioning protein [Streptococcus oricebi]